MTETRRRTSDPWRDRVEAGDWGSITAELDEYGGALLPRLLTDAEARELRELYPDPGGVFRSTIDLARYRFGAGQYRYFASPYPEPIERLKQALYPRLLPIARDWWRRLGRDPDWPDTLDEWLDRCHAAGQDKSTAILLRYGAGDWNALHRDLYGDLVFPLQVVVNLSEPGVDHTGGEFLLLEQRPRAQSRGTATLLPRATATCSRPEIGRSPRSGAGRRPRCGTESRRSGPANASRSPSSSTTPPDLAAYANFSEIILPVGINIQYGEDIIHSTLRM